MARPRKDIDVELIIKLYLIDGLSIREIEEKTGYSRPTIHRRLKERGVKLVKVVS